jgi:hypothetical protein
MDRLKTVNEARKANETPSPRQALRDHRWRIPIVTPVRLFDLKMRTG